MTASIGYKDIFNAAANGVMVTEAAGYLTHIDRQAETIPGFSAHGHIVDCICDLMPLTGPHVRTCLQSGGPKLGHLIKVKTVDLVFFITPVFDDQGRLHIVGVNARGALSGARELGRGAFRAGPRGDPFPPLDRGSAPCRCRPNGSNVSTITRSCGWAA